MNKLVSVLFIVGLSLGSSIRNYVEEFEGWVNRYKISVTGTEEKERMMDIWVENDKYIEEVNSRNLTYKLGHNQFSGMNNEEYRKFLGLKNEEENTLHPNLINIPYLWPEESSGREITCLE